MIGNPRRLAVLLSITLLGSAGVLVLAQRVPDASPDPGGDVVGVQSQSRGSVQGDNIQDVTDAHGSIQPVRGIQGIDAVMLQNLEAVMRVQTRPEEDEAKGNPAAAA